MWIIDASGNALNMDYIKAISVASSGLYVDLGYPTECDYAVEAIDATGANSYPLGFFETKLTAEAYLIRIVTQLRGKAAE